MMSAFRSLLGALLLGALMLLPVQRANAQSQDAEIYLIRGLFGIYSLGMDSLATKLQAQGYSPKVIMWDNSQTATDEIVANHRRGFTGHIILIGHSLGANAVIGVSNQLAQQGIAVDLAVTFDVTEPLTVPTNVERYINFYQNNGLGKPASPAPGFTGEFSNMDLTSQTNLSHTNIDEAPQLQAFVMDRVYDLMHQHVRTVQAKRKGKRT